MMLVWVPRERCSAQGKTKTANQDLRLGPSWVLMVLLNLVEKRLIFTSKWTITWHHGVRDASLNTHLQSFDGPVIVEEEQPSVETPA